MNYKGLILVKNRFMVSSDVGFKRPFSQTVETGLWFKHRVNINLRPLSHTQHFKFIWLYNLFAMSVPDEGY